MLNNPRCALFLPDGGDTAFYLDAFLEHETGTVITGTVYVLKSPQSTRVVAKFTGRLTVCEDGIKIEEANATLH